MTHELTSGISAFCTGFSGQTLTPSHPEYDKSRAIWNGAIDRKPALIACCTTARQVADAIRFARERKLQIAMQATY
jgi:FAD/FMN-containing dehydrogenase